MSAATHAIPVRQENCVCGAWRACWPGSGLISTCNDTAVCYGNTGIQAAPTTTIVCLALGFSLTDSMTLRFRRMAARSGA